MSSTAYLGKTVQSWIHRGIYTAGLEFEIFRSDRKVALEFVLNIITCSLTLP